MTAMPLEAAEMKRIAAEAAVDAYVKDGMNVGLGTGSTAYYAIRRICEPVYEHVDNHFSPLPAHYVSEFRLRRDRMAGLISEMSEICSKGEFETLRDTDEKLKALQSEFSDLRKALMIDIQSKQLNLTVAYLYLNILQESEQITIVLRQLSRASRKFQLG